MRETASGSGACVSLVNPLIKRDPKLKIVAGGNLFSPAFQTFPMNTAGFLCEFGYHQRCIQTPELFLRHRQSLPDRHRGVGDLRVALGG